jgi:hypothetical protein
MNAFILNSLHGGCSLVQSVSVCFSWRAALMIRTFAPAASWDPEVSLVAMLLQIV